MIDAAMKIIETSKGDYMSADKKLLGLREWAERVFETPPHYNTLLNWVHNGSISPKPKKMGKLWYVKPNAEYQG